MDSLFFVCWAEEIRIIVRVAVTQVEKRNLCESKVSFSLLPQYIVENSVVKNGASNASKIDDVTRYRFNGRWMLSLWKQRKLIREDPGHANVVNSEWKMRSLAPGQSFFCWGRDFNLFDRNEASKATAKITSILITKVSKIFSFTRGCRLRKQ